MNSKIIGKLFDEMKHDKTNSFYQNRDFLIDYLKITISLMFLNYYVESFNKSDSHWFVNIASARLKRLSLSIKLRKSIGSNFLSICSLKIFLTSYAKSIGIIFPNGCLILKRFPRGNSQYTWWKVVDKAACSPSPSVKITITVRIGS